MKFFSLFLCCVLAELSMVSSAISGDTHVRVIIPAGLPAISMAEMIEGDAFALPGYQVEYTVLKSPDLLAGKLISGDAELAIVPTNLAIKLYNKGVKVKYCGGSVWGILYMISQQKSDGWQVLKGKEIYSLGRGLTPDIVLRYLLSKNGLEPGKDVQIHYVNNAMELAPSFLLGKSNYSVIPEPALSMVLKKKPDTHVMLDLQKEWSKETGMTSGYPQACLIALGDFADREPEFVNEFRTAFGTALAKVNADPQHAAQLASQYLKTPAAPVMATAIPRSNLKWVDADTDRKALEAYYKILYAFEPAVLGGKMPDDNFYLEP